MRIKTGRFFKMTTALVTAAVLMCGCGVLAACVYDNDNGEDFSETVIVKNVKLNNFDLFYSVGDEISFDGITLTVNYSDRSTKEITKMKIHTEGSASDVTELAEEIEETDDFEKEDSAGAEEPEEEDDVEFILYTDGLYERTLMGAVEEGNYALSCLLMEDGETYELGTVIVKEDIASELKVLDFEEPSFLREYKLNLERCGDEDKANDDEFIAEAEDMEYCVGDDNGFVFMPELTLVYENPWTVSTATNYDVDVTVSLLTENGEEELKVEDNLYFTYSDFCFDFKEKAVGEKFDISMEITAFETYDANIATKVGMEVRVCDGYNVYDALDLGRINLVSGTDDISKFVESPTSTERNHNTVRNIFWDEGSSTYTEKATYEIWKKFLTEAGEDPETLTRTNGIFLHGNIAVTQADIPEDYFIYTDEAVKGGLNDNSAVIGTIRDQSFPYTHFMTEDFTFNGNLFKIDCSAINYCYSLYNSSPEAGKEYLEFNDPATTVTFPTTDAGLFTFLGLIDSDSSNPVCAGDRCLATFENVELVGNTSYDKSNTAKEEGMASGSLKALQATSSKLLVENCIVKEFLMGVKTEYASGYTAADIGDSKFFDCYITGLYTWVSAQNEIANSVFARIGGPVVLSCSKTTEDGGNAYGEYYESGCTVDDKTVMDNYLAGDEAWFVNMGLSSVVTGIFDWFENCFNAAGYTIKTGISSSVGADGTQIETPAVNIQFLATDNGIGSSSDESKRLNVNYTRGEAIPFILNEDVLEEDVSGSLPTYDAEESSYSSEAEYNAALMNYHSDNKSMSLLVYTLVPPVFVADDEEGNHETFCLNLSIASTITTPFYSLYSYDTTTSNRATPDLSSGFYSQLYMYIDMVGYRIAVGMELAPYTAVEE